MSEKPCSTFFRSQQSWSCLAERTLSIFLGIILLLNLVLFCITRRIPNFGDTWLQFTCLYYNLNAIINGEWCAKWLKYTSHGSTGGILLHASSSFFMMVVDLLASVVRDKVSLPNGWMIVAVDIFVEEFILFLGTWLLCRRLYSNVYTVFFVSATIVLTTVNPEFRFFTLDTFYSMPLVVYLIIYAFEERRREPFYAGVALALMSSVNLVVYFSIVQLFVYTVFFISLAVLYFSDFKNGIQRVRPSLLDIVAFAVFGAVIFSLIYVTTFGHNDIVRNGGRLADGSVPLESFLAYGGYTGVGKYADIFRGIQSTTKNFSVYRGYLTVFFACFALLSPTKRMLPFAITAFILFLFSLGDPFGVAALTWYIFPGMKYCRHIAYVAPGVTMMLCFIAGFGFDSFFSTSRTQWKSWISLAVVASSIIFILPKLSSKHLEVNYDSIQINFALVSYIFVLLSLVFIIVTKKVSKIMVFLLLFLNFLDVSGYRFNVTRLQTIPLSAEAYAVTEFSSMRFVQQRSLGYDDCQRYNLLARDTGHIKATIIYDQMNNVFQHELYFEVYPNLISPQPQYDLASKLADTESVARRNIAGFQRPVLQFFSNAYFFESNSALAQAFSLKGYSGNALFLSSLPAGLAVAPGELETLESKDDRLSVDYNVKSFGANYLTLEFPHPLERPTWIYYADTWDKKWKAFADNLELPVCKAFIAYKAVYVPKGTTHFSFVFIDHLYDYCTGILRIFSLALLAWIVTFTIRYFRRPCRY